jgi:hypothetical protein
MDAQLTINRLITYFKNIATQHKQIRSFNYGPLFDVSNIPNVVYPLLYMVPQSSTITPGNLHLVHKLYMIDLVDKNDGNRLDISSDMFSILLGIRGYIQKDFSIEILPAKETAIEPIFEKFDDEVAGWVMELPLDLNWYADVCIEPGLIEPGETFTENN